MKAAERGWLGPSGALLSPVVMHGVPFPLSGYSLGQAGSITLPWSTLVQDTDGPGCGDLKHLGVEAPVILSGSAGSGRQACSEGGQP